MLAVHMPKAVETPAGAVFSLTHCILCLKVKAVNLTEL